MSSLRKLTRVLPRGTGSTRIITRIVTTTGVSQFQQYSSIANNSRSTRAAQWLHANVNSKIVRQYAQQTPTDDWFADIVDAKHDTAPEASSADDWASNISSYDVDGAIKDYQARKETLEYASPDEIEEEVEKIAKETIMVSNDPREIEVVKDMRKKLQLHRQAAKTKPASLRAYDKMVEETLTSIESVEEEENPFEEKQDVDSVVIVEPIKFKETIDDYPKVYPEIVVDAVLSGKDFEDEDLSAMEVAELNEMADELRDFLEVKDEGEIQMTEEQLQQMEGELQEYTFEDMLAEADDPDLEDERFEQMATKYASVDYHDLPSLGRNYEWAKLHANVKSVTDLTENNLGQFYIIKNDQYKTYFPEGLAGELDKVHAQLHQRAIMVRKPALTLVNHLKDMLENFNAYKAKIQELQDSGRQDLDTAPELEEFKSPEKNKYGYLLHGPRGVGKSATLSHVVQWARESGMVVLFIPDGYKWAHGNSFVEPSPILKGYFDSPEYTAELLEKFRDAHFVFLKSRELLGQYDLHLGEGQKAPTNLFGLINWGLTDIFNSGIALKILLDELSNIHDVPIMIAIDGYNYLTGKTSYSFGNLEEWLTSPPKPVHAHDLVLMRGLNIMLAQNHPNKIFVCASSKKREVTVTKKKDIKFKAKDSVLEGILVEPYTRSELEAIFDYYTSVYHIQGSHIDQVIKELEFMSGRNPEVVWQQMSMF